MARVRLKLKRISSVRDRKLAFTKRTEGLMRKMSDFSSICKVKACLIIYDPRGHVLPVTWPQDPKEVQRIVEKYEHKKNEKPPKNYDLKDFFEHKKNMIETEIAKVQKEILKIKYPTWDDSFNSLGEEQLRGFITMLDTKLEACNQRVNMLKNKRQTEAIVNFMQNMPQGQLIPTPMMPLNENNLLPSYPPKLDMGSQSQMLHLELDPNLMELLAKNNGMVDRTNQVGVPLDCTKQIGDFVDSTNQIGEHVDWGSQFVEPLNWVSPLVEPVDWVSQHDVPVNWTTQLSVPVVGSNYIHNTTATNGAFNYDPKFNVLEENGDENNPGSVVCNYNGGVQTMQLHNYDPALQNIPSHSQNVQQGAAFHTLPPPMDGFQMDDYYNLLESQLFN